MPEFEYAIYNAFTRERFGGSPAALVRCHSELSIETMQQIAREFNVPASGFITGLNGDDIAIRFFSTQTEYPMCGHGSIALARWLAETGLIDTSAGNRDINLSTPTQTAKLLLENTAHGIRVNMALKLAQFEQWAGRHEQLETALGLGHGAIQQANPIGYTDADFRTLIVPLSHGSVIRAMKPDFTIIRRYCMDQDIDTIMVFVGDMVNREIKLHCREFCPAVGASEAPASGTTQRALACYLHHFRVYEFPSSGSQYIHATQGVEMGRPSEILTQLALEDGRIARLSVGGFAAPVMEGKLLL